MDNLKIGTIVKLADQKNYYIFDTITIKQKNYVLMTPEEEHEEQEEIYVLQNNIDSEGRGYFSSINNDEMSEVLTNFYRVYQEAGIIEKGRINTKNYIKFIEGDETADAIKKKYELNRLEKIVDSKDEKLAKAKELLIENRNLIKSYSDKIDTLQAGNKNLEAQNEMLNNAILGLPKIVRKIFIKNDKKLLK